MPLRDESFDDDTQNIVAAVLGTTGKERAWEDKGKLWSKFAYAGAGIIAALAIMLIVALVHFWLVPRPLAASIGGPSATMILIAAAIVFGGWAGLKYEARKRRLR